MKKLALAALAAIALLPAAVFGQTPLVNSSKMIADGVVTEPKLSPAVQAKLNAAYALIPTVQALGVSTAALAQAIGSETAARIAADYAVGASTEALALALLNEYNDRIAAEAAIGLSTAALDAAKVAKAGDSMSGSLSFTVPVTGINWQDGSVSTTANQTPDLSGYVQKAGDTMTGPLVVDSDLSFGNVLKSTDSTFQVGKADQYGRPRLWLYRAGAAGPFLELGANSYDGDGVPSVDSDGLVVWSPSTESGARIKADRFGLTSSNDSSLYYFRVDKQKMLYSGGDPSTGPWHFYSDRVSGNTGFGRQPNGSYKVDVNGKLHASSVAVDGTITASTFQAVGSAFIVGDNFMDNDGISLGSGGSIVLSANNGDVIANNFSGDGAGVTGLQPSNMAPGNFPTGSYTFDFNGLGDGLFIAPAGAGHVRIVSTADDYSLRTSSSIEMQSGALYTGPNGIVFNDGTSMQTAASGGGALNYAVLIDSTSGDQTITANTCATGYDAVIGSTLTLTGVTAGSRIEIGLTLGCLSDNMFNGASLKVQVLDNGNLVGGVGIVAGHLAMTCLPQTSGNIPIGSSYISTDLETAGTHDITLMACEKSGSAGGTIKKSDPAVFLTIKELK